MGHPNYSFKLGQIISKPVAVNGLYSDFFIDAYPINSTKDLTEGKGGDVNYYRDFITALGDRENYTVREQCFPYRGSDESTIGSFGLSPLKYSSFLDNLSLDNGISIALWVSLGASNRWSLNMRSGVYFDIDRVASSAGHVHEYLPVSYTPVYVATNPTEGNGWVKMSKPSPPRDSVTSAPTLPNVIEFNYKGAVYSLSGSSSNYSTNNVGDFAFISDSNIVNKTTGEAIAYPIYNQIADSQKQETTMFYPSYRQATLGTNMLLVTSVNRTVFEEEDLSYVRGLVGTVFLGVLPIEFYRSSQSLDIEIINNVGVIRKTDYPDFFSYYGITDETFDGASLIDRNDVRKILKLYNVDNINDIGKYKPLEFPEELATNMDTYLPHKSKFFKAIFPQIKVRSGIYSASNIEAAGPLKNTLPTRVTNNPYTSPGDGDIDRTIVGGDGKGVGSTGFTLSPQTFIILKSKI